MITSLAKFLLRMLLLLKVPAAMRWLLNADQIKTCLQRTEAAATARFGPLAVVHNRSGASRVKIGAGSLVDGELLVHDYGGQIEIGANTYVGQGSRIWSGESVKVGRDVFIAHNVNITDTNSHQLDARERHDHYVDHIVSGNPFRKGSIETAPVVIGDHAWINFNVGILKGVTIGEGAIVGAFSLVTKDVPPYTLVAGNPLREIRKLPRPT